MLFITRPESRYSFVRKNNDIQDRQGEEDEITFTGRRRGNAGGSGAGRLRPKGNEAKHIKVGVINGAEQDVAEVAKKVAKEKYGLEVELVGFSGSLLPNESTNAGDLDANVFQHRPFLEQDNKAHNYHLVAVGNTFVFPMAGYSRKIKSVAELKDGATIAIPNDPTNLGRALLLLQREADYPQSRDRPAADGGGYHRQPA